MKFAVEDWWISDIASFQNLVPSKVFIESLEDSEIYTLNQATKEELLQKVPKFERTFRLMMQRYVVRLQNAPGKYYFTACRFYLDFIKMYPTIPQRVAQYYIASYLDIP